MSYGLAKQNESYDLVKTAESFGLSITQTKVDLLKNTVAKDCNDQELAQFLIKAGQTGLDPFANQLCMIRFGGRATPAVTIDGYRAIADRTGCYAPGREPSFEYDGENQLYSATAYVKKFAGGVWHEYAATAFWDEFAQYKKDRNLTDMWRKFPRLMLAKCAESLAIRRGFPAQTAGLYTVEEMGQAQAEIINYEDAEVIEHRPVVDKKTGEIAESQPQSPERTRAVQAYTQAAMQADELGLIACASFDENSVLSDASAEEIAAATKAILTHIQVWKRYGQLWQYSLEAGVELYEDDSPESAKTWGFDTLKNRAVDLDAILKDAIAEALPDSQMPDRREKAEKWMELYRTKEEVPF